jgi:hypothetical protein
MNGALESELQRDRRALKISKSVTGKYVSRARASDVDWEVAKTRH